MREELIVPITMLISVFGIAYIYLTTRNKERMALIEKGQTAELFNKEHRKTNWPLKLGIMAVGVSIGILMGNLLAAANLVSDDISYPAMIFLFAGLGLIVSHIVERPKNK